MKISVFECEGKLILLPQNRVWRTYVGGRRLDELVQSESAQDGHFPEDWIGSVTEARNPDSNRELEGVSKVRIGEQDVLLTELIQQDPDYFLGADHVAKYGLQPMVLVKFLDAAVRLHFQAHPTAEFARLNLGSNSGKAEAYHILEVRDGVSDPYVYLGFQRPPSREEFREAIENQDIAAIESCFDKISVKPGDTLFIPGGVPHAIGEGIFMVEIMEPSDLAVRFEFEKAGYVLPESARFMGKGLDFCLDVFDYESKSESQIRADYMFEPQVVSKYGENSYRYRMIGEEVTDRFRVMKSVITESVSRRDDAFFIGIVTTGSCVIKTSRGEVELSKYDTFFCPAGLGECCIEPMEETHILECFPPL